MSAGRDREGRALELRGLRRCPRCIDVKALAHFHVGSSECKQCAALSQAERKQEASR